MLTHQENKISRGIRLYLYGAARHVTIHAPQKGMVRWCYSANCSSVRCTTAGIPTACRQLPPKPCTFCCVFFVSLFHDVLPTQAPMTEWRWRLNCSLDKHVTPYIKAMQKGVKGYCLCSLT